MHISDLLSRNATIRSWDITSELSALNKKLSLIKDSLPQANLNELRDDMLSIGNNIDSAVNNMYSLSVQIYELQQASHHLMQTLSREPLNESDDRYTKRAGSFRPCDAVISRAADPFADNEPQREAFTDNIRKYTSWQYPTAYVRPNSTHFFNAFKASDVLYVLEQCDIKGWIKSSVTPEFFKMIRLKRINENKDQFITSTLPHNQIGLLVMEYFIDFKPLSVIKQYLEEALVVLRPGGHMMFTYNDCDFSSGAVNFEKGACAYTPGGMLRTMIELLGFEIVSYQQTDQVSWICIRKPGELDSMKAGKTIGCIMRDEAERLD